MAAGGGGLILSADTGGGTLGGVLVVGGGIAFVVLVAWLIVRESRRKRRVRMAAAEAALDEPWLAAEKVEEEAAGLFRAVQEAWNARDPTALPGLMGPDLAAQWRSRMEEEVRRGWHYHLSEIGTPHVSMVGLVNREGAGQDRVTVNVRCLVRPHLIDPRGRKHTPKNVGKLGNTTIREYWTLGRRGERWVCVSIESSLEGDRHMSADVVATPEADVGRIRDQAVMEHAADPAAAAVVDFQGTADQQMLDLSLADGRFTAEVVEVSVRRVLAAWEGAVDGEHGPLEALAEPEPVRRLLHGADEPDNHRVVMRGPELRRLTVSRVEPDVTPVRMELEIEIKSVRYLADRATGQALSGRAPASRSTATERWTMALDGPGESPWRLVAVA